MICRYKIKFISDIEQKIRKLLVNIAVAPFVGVWIEIDEDIERDGITDESLPSWECGLKYQIIRTESQKLQKVAPFVGVWIEIAHIRSYLQYSSSLPSWECGLK